MFGVYWAKKNALGAFLDAFICISILYFDIQFMVQKSFNLFKVKKDFISQQKY
jgi:hypothetical protein